MYDHDVSDSENENVSLEPKAAKETIDFKEVKRVDHILASLQRKVNHTLFIFIFLHNYIFSNSVHLGHVFFS